MSMIAERLSFYFSYDFAWYALIVGVLIALCASVFGVVLVLKRFSFIGDGLSHVAFGAMAIATVLRALLPAITVNDTLIVMPVTVLCAVLLLKTGQHTKIKGDAAIAMLSVGALAVGYLLLSLFPSSANIEGDVCGSLFGSFSILTLSASDVWICLILSVAVIALFALFYHKIFAVTFDEDFARAIGIRASVYNLFIAVITAVIIVLAMNLVGSLLISALIIFPALSAMRVFRSFKGVVLCSAVIAVICATVGILLSLIFPIPVGPTIVVANLAVFAIFWLIGRWK
ncbi:MAG: metal ABC transporter permease [Clostridia bacterium]|nr:metal ABC transporter permease [Clostridia bacterium]